MIALLQISWRMDSERILKIFQYLTKLRVDNVGLLFFGPPCKSIQIKQAQPGRKLHLRLPWEYTLTRVLNTIVNKAKHTIYEKHKQQK